MLATTTQPSSTKRVRKEVPDLPRDRVITLNVGGKLITTLESTLRAHPSRFCTWLDNEFRDLPRDAEGRPFLDRDAENFKNVLNYMRGYGLPCRPEDLVLLSSDAEFYDVKSLKKEIGMDGPCTWRFTPGPGVHEDGTQFSTADILGLCGSESLSTRCHHTIFFRIDKCELVAVGVIALANVKEDQQLYRQHSSVTYRSTGELVRYWADEPLFCSGLSYQAQEVIMVKVQFMPPGCTNGSLPPPLQPASRAPTSERTPMGGPQSTGPVVPDVGSTEEDSAPTQPGATAAENAVTSSPGVDPAEVIGAIITFSKDGRVIFEARWPAPVPPLQFAVSMQGTSSVSIVDAVSKDEGRESSAGGESGRLRLQLPEEQFMSHVAMQMPMRVVYPS